MHAELVNRLGGLSLSRKSVVRLTDRPNMTTDVYRGRKIINKQQQQQFVDDSCASHRFSLCMRTKSFFYIQYCLKKTAN